MLCKTAADALDQVAIADEPMAGPTPPACHRRVWVHRENHTGISATMTGRERLHGQSGSDESVSFAAAVRSGGMTLPTAIALESIEAASMRGQTVHKARGTPNGFDNFFQHDHSTIKRSLERLPDLIRDRQPRTSAIVLAGRLRFGPASIASGTSGPFNYVWSVGGSIPLCLAEDARPLQISMPTTYGTPRQDGRGDDSVPTKDT